MRQNRHFNLSGLRIMMKPFPLYVICIGPNDHSTIQVLPMPHLCDIKRVAWRKDCGKSRLGGKVPPEQKKFMLSSRSTTQTDEASHVTSLHAPSPVKARGLS